MKKIMVFILLMNLLITPVMGEIGSFEGGLVLDPTLSDGEYNYKEILFITGEPILLTGVVTLPTIPTNQNTYNLTYDYTLSNIAENVTLTRSVTYAVTKTYKEAYKQTTYDYKITDLSESIDVNGTEYILNSKLDNKSIIYDNTAAVDYFAGNMYLKRTYYINGDPLENDGKVVIEITSDHNEGAMIGYEHLWGDAETYMAKMTLNGYLPNPEYDATDSTSSETINWYGSVDLKASYQKFSDFKYQTTAPQSISFLGNYVRSDEIETVLQYTYDLPKFDGGTVTTGRNKGENTLRNDKIVDGKSMIIPEIKDIGGHWSEKNIFFLSSLEIINNNSKYYGPDLPLTRIEFAEMISNAIATIEARSQTDIIRSLRPGTEQMFFDIPNDYEFYNYVVFVYNEGIMNGWSGYFNPDDTITRAEVITIMINALGLESRAPMLPFETRYADDAQIPDWSKRFIYMADEIGLVTGFPDNTIRPSSLVTRAEGAAMIVNLIDHMKDNIRIDFREKLINRY